MESIETLIKLLQARPELYIGVPSVTRLSMFLAGYHFAVSRNCNNKSFALPISKFRDWLATYYSVKSMIGWDDILLTQTNGNEALALNLFWEKWDEYCKALHSI